MLITIWIRVAYSLMLLLDYDSDEAREKLTQRDLATDGVTSSVLRSKVTQVIDQGRPASYSGHSDQEAAKGSKGSQKRKHEDQRGAEPSHKSKQGDTSKRSRAEETKEQNPTDPSTQSSKKSKED
jgi:hypothetical protein